MLSAFQNPIQRYAAIPLIMCLLAIIYSPDVIAANGGDITYQGTIVDALGGSVPDGSYDIRFEVFPVVVNGTSDLEVIVPGVQFQNGTFAAQISSAALGSVAENATDSWVQVSVDLDNNNTFEADEVYAPRTALTSVARALFAEKAAKADTATTATTADNAQQLEGNAAAAFSLSGHTHEAAEITDFSDSVNNVDSIIALVGSMHTHANKTFLDTINQNMATTNSVNFNAVSTTAGVSAGSSVTAATTLSSGTTATVGTNLTVNLDAFVGDRLSVGTTAAALADLYISNGGNELTQGIRMENLATDNTNKSGRIKVGHYDTAQGPVTTLVHTNTSTANTLSLGGGSSAFEPAITDFHVYTSPDTITAMGTVRFSIDQDGALSTGGETAPDVGVGGLCLNQVQQQNNILTFKADNVAHGVTNEEETDTFASFSQRNGAFGGLLIKGLGESVRGVDISGTASTQDTDTTTAANAPIILSGGLASGTVRGQVSDTANVLVVRNGSSNRLIVKGDGDVLADGTFTSNGFDMAEYFPAEEVIAPSALVGLNVSTGKVRTYREGDVFVGIQSQNPAFVGNKPFDENRDDHALVGMDGQFENVQGAIVEANVAYTLDKRYRVGYVLANGRILLDKKEL